MKYRILSNTEKELYGANVLAIVDNTDFVALANGNTGSFKIHPYTGGDGVTQPFVSVSSPPVVPIGTLVRLQSMKLITPFVFSDATILTSAVTVGDGGSANRYLASTETSTASGAAITYAPGTGTRFAYTATDTILAAFTGTAAKNLNTCTAGAIGFYLAVEDLTQLPIS